MVTSSRLLRGLSMVHTPAAPSTEISPARTPRHLPNIAVAWRLSTISWLSTALYVIKRVPGLGASNQELLTTSETLARENQDLSSRLTEAEDGLASARASLRKGSEHTLHPVRDVAAARRRPG